MNNLTTPQAILIGLALIALAVLFQPAIGRLIVTPAYAQGLSMSDYNMFSRGFSSIASAIFGIRACRD